MNDDCMLDGMAFMPINSMIQYDHGHCGIQPDCNEFGLPIIISGKSPDTAKLSDVFVELSSLEIL
jgi:hypothetical protein